jgi:phage shock protein C
MTYNSDYSRSPNPKRLYRSRKESVIAGVCGGIAESMGWDPLLVRIIFIISLLTGFLSGIAFIGYLAVWALVPRRPFESRLTPEEETFWRGVSDRPAVTFSNLRYSFRDMEERLQGLERAVTSDEWRLKRQFKDLDR